MGELVDVRSLNVFAPHEADVRAAEIIDEEEDDIGPWRRVGRRREVGEEREQCGAEQRPERVGGLDHGSYSFALFFRLPLPGFASLADFRSVFGVGIGALIAVRQASIFACSSFALSGSFSARLVFSPMSSCRL